MSGAPTIEERLRRLEDLEEIRNLVKDYAKHLDVRDFEAYSALFTREGEWAGGSGRAGRRHELFTLAG